ncbi:DUF1285 domain-containing protein [Aliikangiella sp. IMCC44632]
MSHSPESLIRSIGDSPLPPVENWNPDYCGELDLVIKADGTWLYSGTPFTRRKMQLLFSRIIKKEAEKFYLVTPVEKLAIQVEWQPFTIIDFNIKQHNGMKIYEFIDNCDNLTELKSPQQIVFSSYQDQRLPCVKVRRNLFASFSRSCYYRLIESAQLKTSNNIEQVLITSHANEFIIGTVDGD